MGQLIIPGETGKVSDGYHTFDELYDHRCLLFIALMITNPDLSWRSQKHHDGSAWAGWFIAGMSLPTGQITYHIPEKFWNLLEGKIEYLDCAPAFDGHTSDDVLLRLEAWIKGGDRYE